MANHSVDGMHAEKNIEKQNEKNEEAKTDNLEEYLMRKREEELEHEARNVILTIIKREVDIIARYTEFRVTELFTKGIVMNYHVRREFSDKHARIIIELEIPEYAVELAKRRLGELRGLMNKVLREMRKDDRYKYRFD